MPSRLRKSFINFRTCNHKLPIETRRWQQIDRILRNCNRCLGNITGDEYHYGFECPFFDFDRRVFVPFIRRMEAVLTSTTIYVLSRIMKNIRIFYLKIFIFWW